MNSSLPWRDYEEALPSSPLIWQGMRGEIALASPRNDVPFRCVRLRTTGAISLNILLMVER